MQNYFENFEKLISFNSGVKYFPSYKERNKLNDVYILLNYLPFDYFHLFGDSMCRHLYFIPRFTVHIINTGKKRKIQS